MSGEVRVKMDMPQLGKALLQAELDILSELGEEAVALAQDQWVGWQYAPLRKGVPYPEQQRGESHDAWHFEQLEQASKGDTYATYNRGITILNDAEIQGISESKKDGGTYKRAVGKHYAAYIKRDKNAEPEADIVLKRIAKELVPDASQRLLDEFIKNASTERDTLDLEANKIDAEIDDFDIVL
jgi:hypothetical protein